MKFRYLIAICLVLSQLFISCLYEIEYDVQTNGEFLIKLDGFLEHVPTKVNAQGFEDGDALGVYAVNYEDNNQYPGTLLDKGNQVDHMKYIFDEKNWKWNPSRPVYYKDVNTNIDLYAFYPYGEPSSVSEYNFEVQKDQSTPKTNVKLGGYEASDFLWGKTENVVPSESAIKVKLRHKMAGVQVILQEGTGFEQAEDYDFIEKKILVTSTTRKAKINLKDGTVSPIGEAQSTGIIMAAQSDGSYRAIVVPQEIKAGYQLLSITIDGMSYGFEKDATTFYEAGKLMKYTIRVDRKLPSGEYELELIKSEIEDWVEDINIYEGEARQYYCVQCEEPGTLGQQIKADSKNPNKIRN